MKREKLDTILLICMLFIATLYHLVPPLMSLWATSRAKYNHKVLFNKMMDERVSEEILGHLKILINNYESLQNSDVLRSRDAYELKKAVDDLKICHSKVWRFYTPYFYFMLFGPIYLPVLVYIIKKLKYLF